jgi:ABC-type sugar transport system substrate-binding protein
MNVKGCAVVGATALLCVGGLAACGSSSKSSGETATSTSPASGAAVSQALTKLAPYKVPSPTISLTPLKSKPPTGKSVDFISCPLPTCQEYVEAMKSAAASIGWTVKSFNGGLTPATVTSAWNSVVQSPGDAVVAISILPNSALTSQLAALRSKGVPVLTIGGPNGISDGIIAHFIPRAASTEQSKIWADWIIADSNAHATVLYYTDPAFTSLLPYKQGFIAEMNVMCHSCSVDVQSANYATGVGTTIPSQVVSYLQRNPSVGYIVFNVGNNDVGVPQALAAAGLAGKVKIVTGNTGVVNMKAIAAGTQAMGVTGESYETGWRAIDTLIRQFEGMPIDPEPIGKFHIITKKNIPSNLDVPYTVPNYESDFKKAWQPVS